GHRHQRAEQRLQPAADFDHLRQPQPVQRGDGDRSALRPAPRSPRPRPGDRRRRQPRAAVGLLLLGAQPGGGPRQPPEPVRGGEHRLFGGAGLQRRPGGGGDQRGDRPGRPAHRGAGVDRWYRRHAAEDPAGSAADDSRRAGDRLHRARRALRELRASADHPLHLALGRRRRLAGHPAHRGPVQPDLAAGPVPADRHRHEERHPDDRPGAAAGARGPRSPGGHPRGLPAALPADPDDHPGGHSRRLAAAAGRQRGRRDAPAAGSGHRRRAAAQPTAHALHHAGGVPVLRPPAPALQTPTPADRTGCRLMNAPFRFLVLALAVTGLSACALGPDYQRPELEISDHYRQVQGWKPAAPADTLERGAWWALYDDWELNALAERLNVSNQNLAAAEARYRQARALVHGARAAFYPTVSAGVEAGRASGSGSQQGLSGGRRESFDASLGLSWQLDLWGRLRRTLEAERAGAQASQADLAAVRLSLQAELVQNYLQLCVLDEQRRLLDATLEAYQRSLRLTENQYRAGIVPKSDVT